MKTHSGPVSRLKGGLKHDPGRHRGVQRRGGILRFVGHLFLAAAVLLGGFIAWTLWGTALFTSEAQGELREQFAHVIEGTRRGQPPPLPVPGGVYGILQIERMELNTAVVQGTDAEALQRGAGHYLSTDDPWDPTGRVGIAGHRTTYLAPFWDLDELQRGDLISLVTARGTYYWKVTELNVVEPDANYVLETSLGAAGNTRIGSAPTNSLGPSIVLTTCHPKFSAAQRLVAFGKMVGPPANDATLGDQQRYRRSTAPPGSLFADPRRLLFIVGIGTGAAFVIGVALAVFGARQRRHRLSSPEGAP